jgi:enterochelin esterase family protein
MGASLGAVAALSTAWQYPEAFGGLLLLSGSFAHRIDGEWGSDAFSPVAAFLAELEAEPRLARVEASTRAYLSAGRYEALIDLNRRLLPRLRAQGIEVDYEETWDGHHWGSWRDRLRRALRFLLPGPAHREP